MGRFLASLKRSGLTPKVVITDGSDFYPKLLAGRRLRMKANCPSTKLLVGQLQEFSVAEHDDGPDALEMTIRLAEEMLAGVPNDGLGNRLPVGRD